MADQGDCRKKSIEQADELYSRLAQSEPNSSLPDGIDYSTDADMALYVFNVLEAVEWKWTINEVLEQPEALLHDVIQLASVRSIMRRIEDQNHAR